MHTNRLWDNVKNEIVAAIQSAPDGSRLALVSVDLDHLIHHNDCFGHASGDEALQRVFDRLSALAIETGAQLDRTGGDRFFFHALAQDDAYHAMLGKRVMAAFDDLAIPLVSQGYDAGKKKLPAVLGCTLSAISFPIAQIGAATHAEYDRMEKMSAVESLLKLGDEMVTAGKLSGRGRMVELCL